MRRRPDAEVPANETPPKKKGLVGRLLGPVSDCRSSQSAEKLKLPASCNSSREAAYCLSWPAAARLSNSLARAPKKGDEAARKASRPARQNCPPTRSLSSTSRHRRKHQNTRRRARLSQNSLLLSSLKRTGRRKAAIEPVMPCIIDSFRPICASSGWRDIRRFCRGHAAQGRIVAASRSGGGAHACARRSAQGNIVQ